MILRRCIQWDGSGPGNPGPGLDVPAQDLHLTRGRELMKPFTSASTVASAGILVWSETKALLEDREQENEGLAAGMLI